MDECEPWRMHFLLAQTLALQDPWAGAGVPRGRNVRGAESWVVTSPPPAVS